MQGHFSGRNLDFFSANQSLLSLEPAVEMVPC